MPYHCTRIGNYLNSNKKKKCGFQYAMILIKKKKKSNSKGCSTTAGLQQTPWGGEKRAAKTFPEIQNLQ